MPNRKAILISNPKTGRYVSRRTTSIQELATYLQSLGVDVELSMTTGPGDAAEIAARAAQNGIADVIVAGGDGTINEAVQGLAGTSARLAIIPRGTANVLARELNLPLDGVQAAKRYPGGVALRFARVRGYRPDKSPSDADTIDAVRALLS